MSLAPEIHEATRGIVGILESMRIPYAVGGAIAMGFAGVLRGTRDVDVLILLPAIRSQEFADAADAAGFRMRDEAQHPITVNVPDMARWTRDIGQFRMWWRDVKVELFSPKVPLQDSILRRRQRVSLGDSEMWSTTAEDLILLKMIFHRPKDLDDVIRMLAANRDALDAAYIEGWIEKTLTTEAGVELREMMSRLLPPRP